MGGDEIKCGHCGSAAVVFVKPEEGPEGFMCGDWAKFPEGEGCFRIIQTQKRGVGDVDGEDDGDDDDDDAGDKDDEEDGEFDDSDEDGDDDDDDDDDEYDGCNEDEKEKSSLAAPKNKKAIPEKSQRKEDRMTKSGKENRAPPKGLKSANVAALLSGDLKVKRQPLLPKMLSVSDGVPVIRRQFKSPVQGGTSQLSSELLRRLSAKRVFVPWGGKAALSSPVVKVVEEKSEEEEKEGQGEEQQGREGEANEELPPGIEPLILWQPEDDPFHATETSVPIVVDPVLTRFLRPHQRDGVQFMFECIAGLRDFHHDGDNDDGGGGVGGGGGGGGDDDDDAGGNDGKAEGEGRGCFGCILADDMGLGKTLQSITLLWTALRQGFAAGRPLARRAIIVTPTSLVSNWEAELQKWLQDKVQCLALCESSRADVIAGISDFVSPRSKIRVLIISYETFRLHAERLHKPGSCDLLICDEAHRLKNDQTLTNQALAKLPCRRRVLLSGTPMQNDLEEFFAMVNFTNPGILGSPSQFRKYFEAPILTGREPCAAEEERRRGSERSAELSEKVNQFILRRTNTLLSNHLPPKIVEIVCCRLSPLQLELYRHFIKSKNVRQALADNRKSKVLASITALKKLCNHPKLVYDTIRAGGSEAAGFESCLHFFPSSMFNERSGAWTGGDGSWVELSGKMSVLARLLSHLRRFTDDRIVLVSNYTQTLDLFAQICRERHFPFVRLDGSTSIGKRQKLVTKFNDPTQNEFVFLLSSKAGGCGLNLIGANRLVLFDPDWNPANDKQAAARVWRDGQKKRVFIYRFLAAGTIEEKVYQRQMSKEGLQNVVDSEKASEAQSQVNLLSSEDLRDLFILREETRSDTHDALGCKRCPSTAGGNGGREQVGEDVGGEHGPNSAEKRLDGLMPATPSSEKGGAALFDLNTGAKEEEEDKGEEDEEEEEGCAGGGEGGQESSDDAKKDEQQPRDVGGFAEAAKIIRLKRWEQQVGCPTEEQLDLWAHHANFSSVPDLALHKAAGSDVSFVFSCQIDGKLKPIDSVAPNQQSSRGSLFKAPTSVVSSQPLKGSQSVSSLLGKRAFNRPAVKAVLQQTSVRKNMSVPATPSPILSRPLIKGGFRSPLKKEDSCNLESKFDQVKSDEKKLKRAKPLEVSKGDKITPVLVKGKRTPRQPCAQPPKKRFLSDRKEMVNLSSEEDEDDWDSNGDEEDNEECSEDEDV